MPSDQFRGDLDFLYGPFLERLLALASNCNARGARYVMTEGYRSYATSDKLYHLYLKGGARAARGGCSNHNFGLAGDFVRDVDVLKPGVQPGWSKADFTILIEEATKLGLKSGAIYGDSPHVEWPTFISAADLGPLDVAYRTTTGGPMAKLLKVWEIVDKQKPNLPVLKGT